MRFLIHFVCVCFFFKFLVLHHISNGMEATATTSKIIQERNSKFKREREICIGFYLRGIDKLQKVLWEVMDVRGIEQKSTHFKCFSKEGVLGGLEGVVLRICETRNCKLHFVTFLHFANLSFLLVNSGT